MTVDTLTCGCGLRLKTPGAVPGRVGKCPRCGSTLRVPERLGGPERPGSLESPDGQRTFVRPRGRSATNAVLKKAASDGLVSAPTTVESSWRQSLLYPLWNASGLGVLAFLPVGLWFATVPLFVVLPALLSGTAITLLGVVLLVPQALALFVAGGYTLLFLGQVLVTSCLGEVAQPRSPAWSLSEIGEGLGRWSWALLIGGVVGGFPALVYWINCGDVDWLDGIILVDLIVPGLAYAQMALLASLIFESPLGANPLIVVGAIRRLGWAYVSPCLMTGAAVVVLAGLFAATLRIRDPLGQSAAYLGFWMIGLYASMVVLRLFGLFCYRHDVVPGWSRDRARPAG